MPRPTVLLIAAGVMACIAGVAQTTEYDPLLWDDIVIRGTVQAVEYSSIPSEQWYSPEFLMPGMGPVNLVYTTVRVSEPLRARLEGPDMVIIYGRSDDPREELKLSEAVKPGVEIIATALYRADQSCYVAGLIMVRREGAWHCVRGRGSLKGELLTTDAIRERVESVGINRMTLEADLVILGRIAARHNIGEPGHDYQIYEIEPQKTLKGTAPSRLRLRSKLDEGSLDQKTWTQIPDLDVGSRWYLFLRKFGEEYVVVAGTRAIFRLDGDVLLEHHRVPSAFSPGRLEEVVKNVSREKRRQ